LCEGLATPSPWIVWPQTHQCEFAGSFNTSNDNGIFPFLPSPPDPPYVNGSKEELQFVHRSCTVTEILTSSPPAGQGKRMLFILLTGSERANQDPCIIALCRSLVQGPKSLANLSSQAPVQATTITLPRFTRCGHGTVSLSPLETVAPVYLPSYLSCFALFHRHTWVSWSPLFLNFPPYRRALDGCVLYWSFSNIV